MYIHALSKNRIIRIMIILIPQNKTLIPESIGTELFLSMPCLFKPFYQLCALDFLNAPEINDFRQTLKQTVNELWAQIKSIAGNIGISQKL